jgi:hypothetical protein
LRNSVPSRDESTRSHTARLDRSTGDGRKHFYLKRFKSKEEEEEEQK